MRILSLFFTLLIPSLSSATVILACNDCPSENSRLNVATAHYIDTGTLDIHIVDFIDGQIWRYESIIYSSPSTTICNSCSSNSSYMNAAHAVYRSNGSTNVNIANFSTNKVIAMKRKATYKTNLWGERVISGYTWVSVAPSPVVVGALANSIDGNLRVWAARTVDSAIEAAFWEDYNNFHQNVYSQKITIESDSGWESAWDIFNNGYEQDRFEQYFQDSYPITYWTATLLSTFGGIENGAVAGVEILFEFQDGTQLTLRAPTINEASLKFNYVPGSAVDANGNPLPKRSELNGWEGTFSEPGTLESFASRLSELPNAEVVVVGGSSIPTAYKEVTLYITVDVTTSGGSTTTIRFVITKMVPE